MQLLYLRDSERQQKVTMPIQNWSLTISKVAMFFEGRLDQELKI